MPPNDATVREVLSPERGTHAVAPVADALANPEEVEAAMAAAGAPWADMMDKTRRRGQSADGARHAHEEGEEGHRHEAAAPRLGVARAGAAEERHQHEDGAGGDDGVPSGAKSKPPRA